MRKTDLALRALISLEAAGTTVQASDLAETLHTTRQFVPQVMAPLVRTGWVTSVPGPRGGYHLNTDLAATSLLEVIELVEGPTDNGWCVLGGPCRSEIGCIAHQAWSEARQALLDRLAATPVASVPRTEHTHRKTRGRTS